MVDAGQIVILNGAPRSGKSSIVRAMQATFEAPWINLGVDTYMEATPERYRPGIGLRPGGERPELEPIVRRMFEALYASVAAHARVGLDVVVDVGHHDGHSAPMAILPQVAPFLAGLPALLVGVRCPIEVIMARRDVVDPARRARYLTSDSTGEVPEPVRRWQEAVHEPGIYDFEVDTSTMTPEACAASIRKHLATGPRPSAFERLASMVAPQELLGLISVHKRAGPAARATRLPVRRTSSWQLVASDESGPPPLRWDEAVTGRPDG